jgi:peptidoglycan-associated lipoprotein
MKKLSLPSFVITLLTFLLLTGCGGSKKAVTPEIAKDPYMTFDNPDHDFGTIKVGEKRTHVYSFTNTHSGDIVVELVSGCQCTDVEYDKGKAYKPGETGTIKATFDSNKEEERGALNKTIDILLENTDPKTGYQIIKELRYKVTVLD